MKIPYRYAAALWAVLLLCVSTMPVNAKPHLDHAALMMLQPSPNVKQNGIGIFVYDGVNAQDFVGPMQVFSTAGLRPFLVAKDKTKTVKASNGLTFTADKSIGEVSRLDILVVPGGADGTVLQTMDTDVLAWIKAIDQNTVYTTSVCTGAWILGVDGLLYGKHATTNWYRAAEILQKFGAIPEENSRYVFDGKLVTSAGVTAGIDMALAIVQKLFVGDGWNGTDFTQAVMLDLQYDPKAPIRGGSPARTRPGVLAAMQEMYDMFFYNPGTPGYDWVYSLQPYTP